RQGRGEADDVAPRIIAAEHQLRVRDERLDGLHREGVSTRRTVVVEAAGVEEALVFVTGSPTTTLSSASTATTRRRGSPAATRCVSPQIDNPSGQGGEPATGMRVDPTDVRVPRGHVIVEQRSDRDRCIDPIPDIGSRDT